MIDLVCVADDLAYQVQVPDISLDIVQLGVRLQVGKVIRGSGGLVVDDRYVVTLVQQGFGQVGADESSAASDENSFHVQLSQGLREK